jgi:1-acyl-sn-glycerol-3-phosphate acyltransferase
MGRDALLAHGLQVLDAGQVVLLMPEGRYSWTGVLGAGEPGAALLALHAGVPVVPVVSIGLERVGQALRRLGRAPVTIRFGLPFRLAGQPDGADLQAGTEAIMLALARLLPPEQRGRWAAHPALAQPVTVPTTRYGG